LNKIVLINRKALEQLTSSTRHSKRCPARHCMVLPPDEINGNSSHITGQCTNFILFDDRSGNILTFAL